MASIGQLSISGYQPANKDHIIKSVEQELSQQDGQGLYEGYISDLSNIDGREDKDKTQG